MAKNLFRSIKKSRSKGIKIMAKILKKQLEDWKRKQEILNIKGLKSDRVNKRILELKNQIRETEKEING